MPDADHILKNEAVKEELIQMSFTNYYEKKLMADSIAFSKESEIKDLQIHQQKQQLKSETSQKTILATAVLLLILLTVVVYRNYAIKMKSNELISEKNRELEQANEEVKSLNENLEKIVSDRTEKLQLSLSRLHKYHHDLVHNIRAPLGTLLGLLYLIKHEKFDSKENAEVLEHIHKNTEAVDKVIKSISQEMNVYEDIDDFNNL